jgi:APA family basic amino acid/polyamine antiporter
MATSPATTTEAQPGLKKQLGLFELIATGVGVILGAGIYVIIGEAAGLAGGAIWIPFALGATAAAFTGLSYAELASMFPKAGASFEYANRAFGLRIAFVVGWLMVLANIISAAAVALGFGGYLSSFVGLAAVVAAIGLLAACSMVLLAGIKQSVWLGVLFTAIEVVGLLLVIGVSLRFLGDGDYLEMPRGVAGLFRATALLFFAYLGFEQIANLSEEARNPNKAIPAAIIIAIAISTVLYVSVAVSSVSVLGWEELSQSEGPLADVVKAATGARVSRVVTVIALFATANTVLFLLLTSSRMMYGMASSGTLPKALALIHKRRQTPWAATLVAGGVAVAFALLGDIEVVAQLTNFAVLVAFMIVNAALIWLRYSRPDAERGFRAPLNIKSFSVSALLGIGLSAAMLASIELRVAGYGALMAAAGLVISFFIGRRGQPQTTPDGPGSA